MSDNARQRCAHTREGQGGKERSEQEPNVVHCDDEELSVVWIGNTHDLCLLLLCCVCVCVSVCLSVCVCFLVCLALFLRFFLSSFLPFFFFSQDFEKLQQVLSRHLPKTMPQE